MFDPEIDHVHQTKQMLAKDPDAKTLKEVAEECEKDGMDRYVLIACGDKLLRNKDTLVTGIPMRLSNNLKNPAATLAMMKMLLITAGIPEEEIRKIEFLRDKEYYKNGEEV